MKENANKLHFYLSLSDHSIFAKMACVCVCMPSTQLFFFNVSSSYRIQKYHQRQHLTLVTVYS